MEDAHPQANARLERPVAVQLPALGGAVVQRPPIEGIVGLAQVEGVLEQEPAIKRDADQDQVEVDVGPPDVQLRLGLAVAIDHGRHGHPWHRPFVVMPVPAGRPKRLGPLDQGLDLRRERPAHMVPLRELGHVLPDRGRVVHVRRVPVFVFVLAFGIRPAVVKRHEHLMAHLPA